MYHLREHRLTVDSGNLLGRATRMGVGQQGSDHLLHAVRAIDGKVDVLIRGGITRALIALGEQGEEGGA